MKGEKIENLIRRINFLTTVFMLLPFLTTVTALPFLPDLIPAHYDLDGVINRWGSKYESLIVPIITLGIGLLIMLSTKAIADYDKKSRTILAISGLSFTENLDASSKVIDKIDKEFDNIHMIYFFLKGQSNIE